MPQEVSLCIFQASSDFWITHHKRHAGIVEKLVPVPLKETPEESIPNPAPDQMGTWKLNIAKSKLPPSAANLKESTMVFREIDANTMEGSAKQTTQDGKTTTGKWTTPRSGGIQTYLEGALPKGLSSIAVVVDPDTIYQIYLQDGKQVGLMRIDFSKDGKTFTITGKGTDAQGKPVETLRLFERQ